MPKKFDSPSARAMLIAIGLQESRFEHRKQIGGPARGYWQFEEYGGVRGVLESPLTRDLIVAVCRKIVMPADRSLCYGAIAYHDALACVFARLLLWTIPASLPRRPEDAGKGWDQYIAAWRPGRPHRDTWDGFFRRAWSMIG